ncbi:diguanylate cyclase [Shewanella gaetbuli]|uniref:diguanylate cyclase n=1 Tax=Shewanella gaetbuli TaxID=220752 RepID=A0A9X1ZHX5_9GAMM|nr:diguanylate cyclase [Shewanella gaetbuli]MCL1141327.1 diguanylate cyclase [Shewanella gaetbuli]
MLKKFILLIFFAQSFMVSAANYDNPRADEIFRKIDFSEYKDEAEGRALLSEFKSIIAADDTQRQNQYTAMQCWFVPSESNEQLNEAVEYAERQLLLHSNPIPSEINTELRLCAGYYKQFAGQSEQALSDFEQAIKHAYELDDPRLIAFGRNMRGAMLSYQGNYATALEDLIIAQQLYENIGMDYWANENLSQLATTYRRFGDPETALKYQIKLEQAYKKSAMKFEANTINTQIAYSLAELNKFEESNQRLQDSVTFWQEQQDEVYVADAKISIAGNLLKMNKTDQALRILEAVEPIVTPEFDSVHGYMNLYLAQAYFAKQEYEKAISYTQTAIKDFDRNGNQRSQNESLKLQADTYAAMGNFQQAFKVFTLYNQKHLALDKQTMADRNAEMKARFNTNKIASENELLLKNSQEKEQQLRIMQRNENLQIVIMLLVAIILVIVSVFAYNQVKRKHKFRTLALTDELTGLSNRRDTYHQATQFIAQAKQTHKPFSIISFDADHFKQVNDKWGHDIGDKVLVKLAALTVGLMRDTDVVGRVGGEEFLVLLPGVSHNSAVEIAQRLVDNIAQYNWSGISAELHQTVSAGVVTLTDEETLSPLLLKADHALYEAKHSGRNCVKTAN